MANPSALQRLRAAAAAFKAAWKGDTPRPAFVTMPPVAPKLPDFANLRREAEAAKASAAAMVDASNRLNAVLDAMERR